jgi:hypothetical protein
VTAEFQCDDWLSGGSFGAEAPRNVRHIQARCAYRMRKCSFDNHTRSEKLRIVRRVIWVGGGIVKTNLQDVMERHHTVGAAMTSFPIREQAYFRITEHVVM